jgi:mycofactocin glycosyltransferase
MAAPLPGGFRVVLDRRARRLDGGRVLLGGSPLRLFRLSPDGQRLLDRLIAGATVEAGSLAVGAAGGRLARTLVDAGILHPRPPAGFDPGPVDAVIPVRDRASILPAALAGLGDVRRVVVVDDGSVDASGAVARRLGAEVIRHARPRGPAAARNSGLRAVGAELVALVDSDCVPEPDWLEALLPHFADPAVAAVAPRIGGRRLATGSALARYESVRSAVDLAGFEGRVRWHSRVAFVPTAAMVVRRQAVLDIGGFDEALWLAEDVDLVWRLTMAGWTVRYEPACRVHHEHRKRLGPLLARRAAYGYSAGALSRRHPGKVVPVQLSAWSVLAWGLAAAGAPVVGVAVAVATSARMARGLRGLDHPGREAARLAGLGHLRAGRLLATAVMRAWLPAALVVAMRSRRARIALAACALVPAGLDWWERRPALDPIRYGALRVLDDAAYCAGLWLGCLAEGTAGPLLPDLTGFSVPAPVRRLLRGPRTRPRS